MYTYGMDENLKFGLTLLAGAAGGATIAGIFASVGAWIANKREHNQWIRNEKLKIYAEYLNGIDGSPTDFMRYVLMEKRDELTQVNNSLSNFQTKLELFASAKVLLAYTELRKVSVATPDIAGPVFKALSVKMESEDWLKLPEADRVAAAMDEVDLISNGYLIKWNRAHSQIVKAMRSDLKLPHLTVDLSHGHILSAASRHR